MLTDSFCTVLNQLIARDGRRVRQLSQATSKQFGKENAVPHNSISRWLRGDVQKPRSWPDIVKLAFVLQLSNVELNALLQSAGHPSLDTLQSQHNTAQHETLFSAWHKARRLTPPFQAPIRLSSFVGRATEIKQIQQALLSGQRTRLCCLQGMAGVGKSALAVYLAYELRPHFPDGVLWVQVNISDTMVILQGFAQAYGQDVSHYSDVGSRSSKVREILAGKQLLLVLDNAEGDAEIRPLLPPSGKSAVLITTRNQNLAAADQGERFHITPFSETSQDSLTLFSHILGTTYTQKFQTELTEIASQVGHLPLAIDISANRLKHEPEWNPSRFLQQMERTAAHLNILKRGDRHVQASIRVSFDTLTPLQQQIYAALGVFVGSDFNSQAVAHLVDLPSADVEQELNKLQRFSLIQAGEFTNRYRIHPLLKEFCQSQTKQNQQREFAQRMVNYYIDLVLHNPAKFERLDQEISNILAAFDAAYQWQFHLRLLKGTIGIFTYLQTRGLFQLATKYLERAQQAARDLGNAASLAIVLHHLGYVALKQGEPAVAASYYEEALLLSKQQNNHDLEGDLLNKLGALAHRQGRYAEARNYYEAALALTQAKHNPNRFATLHTNLGLVAAILGDGTSAETHYNIALPIARKMNNHRLIVTLLQNLGSLLRDQGDFAQAKKRYEEGLHLARSARDPELQSRMLGNLGLVACSLENYAQAAAFFRKGLTLAKESGLQLQICRQMANLGKVTSKRRQFEGANFHYQEALSLAKQLNFPEDMIIILNQWGKSYLDQQNFDSAERQFEKALHAARQIQHQREEAASLFGLARVAARRSEVSKARRLGVESQTILAALAHKMADEVLWWLTELPGEVSLD